ncbi:MAG: glycosyltransferase [Anaerolineales bacterium]|nr:glycosyltransferase [Chloroflexota bacterium]MBL6983444.1 glycosyltransferase [Anaerolineales bacterium]
MHIGFYTNAYYPTVSGVVRSVSSFRDVLADQGHNVFIFAPLASEYVDTQPFVFRYPAIDLPQYPQFPFAIPISNCLDRILPSLGLDVVHSHHPVLLGQIAVAKAEELRLPVVFTFHTRYREYSHYLAISQDFVKEQIDHWLRDYMARCHHIIAPSESIRDLLSHEYGVTSQVSVLPTGIDLNTYRDLDRAALRKQYGWEDKLILISVGRLAKEKNWDTLLRAASPILKSDPNFSLVVLGDGAERKDLRKLAKNLEIAGQVDFLGEITPNDIPGYLTAADVFIFASVTETQGLVTMEAMAAGLPVAAIDATGTRDVVTDGIEGFLTENSAPALTAAIELLLDKEMRLQFSQAARQRAETFGIRFLANRLLGIYTQAGEDVKAGRYVRCE